MTEPKNIIPTPALAIVGIGCRFPKANGVDAYWANIKAGLDAITDIPDSHWDPKDYFDEDKNAPDMTYAKRGGFIDPIDFDPLEFGITPNNLEATDTTHLLGLVAARDALRDAGYASGKDKKDGRQFDRDRCSAILGVTGTLELVIPLGARLGHPKWRKALKDAGVDNETADDVVKRISNEYVPWQENSFPGLLGNVAAGRIANRFDLGGTNCVVDAACASSLSALHLAAMELYTGRSDMAITGGVDTFNDIFMFMCFSKTPALSPTGNSKPFSAEGDGTILGEGVGVVILKRLDDAQRDHDKIYAVIRGIGSSSDGLGNAIYAPSARGQSKALKNAYAVSGVNPKDVELVEAHGTGTKVGDRIELEALTEIYGQENSDDCWCAVGSVKSMIGHTKASAGIASLIKATLSLKNKVLPPSIKASKPLDIIKPGTAPLYLNNVQRPWVSTPAHKRFAALSALGFGGSNFHCVLEEAHPIKTQIDWDPSVLVYAWSAANKQGLIHLLQEQISKPVADLRALAQHTRANFKTNDLQRIILVLQNENLQNRLEAAIQQLNSQEKENWSLPNGTFYGSAQARGKLAVVFPGQGSQYNGMLRDLACQFPPMLESLEQANSAFGNHKPQQRISDAIYPIPVFEDAEKQQQEEHLRQTNYTQLALGAVSYGAWKICEQFEIESHAFAGHSYGELVALCAAGRIDEPSLHALSAKRGSLMASGSGDRGSMLAVSAPLDKIEALLKTHKWDIVIANRNSPQQAVLSGSSADIDKAQVVIEKEFRCRKLAVAAAFHSRFVQDSEKPFREFLTSIPFASSATSVYANKTAATYPNADKASKDILAAQLVNPVAFVEQITAMHKDGITSFLEVGPGNVLSNLISKILEGKSVNCITLDASKGRHNGNADLAKCFAHIAALGYSINLAKWDADYSPAEIRGGKMSIKISGANHRSSYKVIPPTPARPIAQAQNQQAAPMPQQSQAIPAQPASQQSALLQATQHSIQALQQMQQNMALLHQQYLSSQESAQNSITQLLMQQQQLFSGQALTPMQFNSVPTMQPLLNPQLQAQANATMPAPVSMPSAPTPVIAQSSPAAPLVPTRNSNHVDIGGILLEIVSEKTGYPNNMLQLSMNLDADLGIDSIKRVEILSALQDRIPGLPSIRAEDMGQIQTLADIVHYGESQQAQAAVPVAIEVQSATQASIQQGPAIDAVLLAIVAEKTGYPLEMLQLTMNLDADLGIDSIKRVEILSALQDQIPNLPTVAAEDMGTLSTLADIVAYLQERSPSRSVSTNIQAHTSANQTSTSLQVLLLEIVADKTGYPREMLDLNMQLDADLGIDSIKRVEILSALQDRDSSLPTIEADALSSIHTLADIIKVCKALLPAAQSQTTMTPSSSVNTDTLKQQLLSIVSEKTGYPQEMLDLDMHLDADLGIDSIKRVEILSSVQEHIPEAPVVQADEMGSLQTLRDVFNYLSASLTPASSAPAATPATTASTQNQTDTLALTETLLLIVAEKTGYPQEMLDINMQLDADLGIDSIKRVEILSALQEQIPHAPVVQADEIGNIHTLKDIIEHICTLNNQSGSLEQPQSPAPVDEDLSSSNDSNTYAIKRMPLNLSALDAYRSRTEFQSGHSCIIIDDFSGLAEPLAAALPCKTKIISDAKSITKKTKCDALIILAQTEFSDAELYERFTVLQKLLPILDQQQGLCSCICNIGNGFGLNGPSNVSKAAAWSGIIKTVSHEFPNIRCKVIDFPHNQKVQLVVDELQFTSPIEVAITESGSFTSTLNEQALPTANSSTTPVLTAGDTVIVTGGARGVTADVAFALAQRFQCNLALLGRSALPQTEAAYLQSCTNEASIKQALIKNWNSGTPTPKLINEQCTRILADREIRNNIEKIKALGVQIVYYAVDVRKTEELSTCINEVRSQFGHINGIIHGAGVLADKLIVDKSIDAFASVWETKIHGAQNLIQATEKDALKCVVFFSSSTARFGRTGQADYAAANEVLNKMAQQLQKEHKNRKILSINWGPWDGGMVTAALKQLFRNEGIEVIHCETGAQYLCDELNSGPGPVEIVILGDTPQEKTNSKAPTVYQNCARIAFELNLAIDSHPFLSSHVINNRAVLPVAIIIEWLTHAAIHENPGLNFHGLDGLCIYKGIVINAGERYPLQFHISETSWEDGVGSCSVEIKQNNILHARANIRLADSLAQAKASSAKTPKGKVSTQNYYADKRLFHGPDLQGIIEVQACDASGIVCTSLPAPAAQAWIQKPMRKDWYADPLALDVAFQAMIVWSHEIMNCASLPTRVGHYYQYQNRFPKDGCKIIARIRSAQKHNAIADIEFIDHQGRLIARIEDYECVIDPLLSESFTRNTLREEINS